MCVDMFYKLKRDGQSYIVSVCNVHVCVCTCVYTRVCVYTLTLIFPARL